MHLLYRSRGPDRHFHSIANPHQLDGRDPSRAVSLAAHGASEKEISFLRHRSVELNAMLADVLVRFLRVFFKLGLLRACERRRWCSHDRKPLSASTMDGMCHHKHPRPGVSIPFEAALWAYIQAGTETFPLEQSSRSRPIRTDALGAGFRLSPGVLCRAASAGREPPGSRLVGRLP
jgi:hypothetical protein